MTTHLDTLPDRISFRALHGLFEEGDASIRLACGYSVACIVLWVTSLIFHKNIFELLCFGDPQIAEGVKRLGCFSLVYMLGRLCMANARA